MERLSEIISKKIISLEEGICPGYILSPSIDFQTMSIYGFLVCDESEERIKFLDFKNILAVDEYVIIKNGNMLSFGENLISNSPIGKEVISANALSLGCVEDIYLQKNKIIKLITNKSEINPNNIYIWEGNYLIFSEKKIKKHRVNKFQRLDKKIIQKVEIQENKNMKEKINSGGIKYNSSILPFKANISSQSLLGKIAICDVFGLNNEIIIRKNEVITNKIIAEAKRHNKLNLLFVSSK